MTWTTFDGLCVGSWDHFLEFQTKTSSGFQGLFLLNYMAALKLGTRNPDYSGCALSSEATLLFSVSDVCGILILHFKCMGCLSLILA